MIADDSLDASRRALRPAGSAATEDRGQRAGADTSALRDVSDTAPAGRGAAAATPPRREAKLDVRLRAGDRAAIDRRTEALGVRSSAWARAVLLDALDSRRGEVEAIEAAASTPGPDPAVAAAVEQLRRVGVLLNQEVRAHHQGEGEGPGFAALAHVAAQVGSLRDALGDRTVI